MKLKRHASNPILSANKNNKWEDLCVLNPAVVLDESNRFVMLYRAAGNDAEHYIYLGLATSEDGIHFVRKQDTPVLSPTQDNCDSGCVEDPRLVKMDGIYFLTYASRPYPPGRYWSDDKKSFGFRPPHSPYFLKANSTQTHLAITEDFISYKKLGRITDSRYDDRDVIIFPERVGGQYVRLSRPMEWCGEGYPCKNPSIWISYSTDLMEWGKPSLLMEGEAWWEDKKIGGSCPPIKTDRGWLHIYHGVASTDSAYRVGAVLLDLNNPSKILARTPDFILQPELEFETNGYYNGCVFPTANVVKDDVLYVYYGAADKYICVATICFSEFVDYLADECRV